MLIVTLICDLIHSSEGREGVSMGENEREKRKYKIGDKVQYTYFKFRLECFEKFINLYFFLVF